MRAAVPISALHSSSQRVESSEHTNSERAGDEKGREHGGDSGAVAVGGRRFKTGDIWHKTRPANREPRGMARARHILRFGQGESGTLFEQDMLLLKSWDSAGRVSGPPLRSQAGNKPGHYAAWPTLKALNVCE